MNNTLAAEYIRLTNLWNDTSPDVINNNVVNYLSVVYPECRTMANKMAVLSEVLNVSKHTAYAWFNRSRGSVKIPLIHLCTFANKLNANIDNFFVED